MSAIITGSQNGTVGLINAGTAVASTSGTSIDFTGIPAGVKRVTVQLAGVSVSSTGKIQVQLGTGGTPTYTTSGYVGSTTDMTGSLATSNISTGFMLNNSGAAFTFQGTFTITNVTGTTWACTAVVSQSDAARSYLVSGTIALAAVLTAVRITTNSTDTFDAGSINILYE